MGKLLRGREVTRLEAFSDGVFAFSATLLVVSLEVPRTVPALIAELRGFVAFGLSFGALVLIWCVHNAFFRRYGLQDPWTVFLNSCLLFVILFYVYPLKFLAEGFAGTVLGLGRRESAPLIQSWEELGSLFVLYDLGFIAIFLCVALLYWHANRRRGELGLDPGEAFQARLSARNYGIYVVVGLVSLLLAGQGIGVKFGLPGWVYALLGPLCWGHWALSMRRAPAPVA